MERQQIEFSPEVAALAQAVLDAGVHLWRQSESGNEISVQIKADNTLVLNLDLECEQILKKALPPGLPVVSEEDAASHGLIGSRDPYYLIDPVDGTTSCKRFLSSVGGQIGFGPLGGLVKGGRMWGAAFMNLPQRALFIAERTLGSFRIHFPSLEAALDPRWLTRADRLQIDDVIPMRESAVLFFAGIKGELLVIEELKRQNLIENVYRFGGFANDCSRLAQGFEQLQVQFSVKAWDLPGALFAELAGSAVILDPLGEPTPLSVWQVAHSNPLLSSPPSVSEKLVSLAQSVIVKANL